MYLTYAQLLVLVSLASSRNPSCYEEGTTWNHKDLLDGVPKTSALECQVYCSVLDSCSHFTFNLATNPSFPNFCYSFKLGEESRQEDCNNCISGPSNCLCSGEESCSVEGEALLDLVAGMAEEIQCQVRCLEYDGCQFYTWFDASSLYYMDCYLFSSCDSVDTTCRGCHSGRADCGSDWETTTRDPTGTTPSPTATTPTGTTPTTSPGGTGTTTDPTSTTTSGPLPSGQFLIFASDKGSGTYPRQSELIIPPAPGNSGLGGDSRLVAGVGEDRAFHTLDVLAGNSGEEGEEGRRLVACGGGSYVESRCSCLEYNVEEDTWVVHSNYTVKRIGHSSVVIKDRLYLIGGYNEFSTQYILLSDPMRNWVPGIRLVGEAYHACAVATSPDTFAVVGKTSTTYNITSAEGSFLPVPSVPRKHHGCAYVDLPGLHGVLIAGGLALAPGEGEAGYLRGAEFYHLESRAWETLADMTVTRDGVSVVVVEDRIFAVGGSNIETSEEPLGQVTVEEYLPESNTWSTLEGELMLGMLGTAASLVPASMFPSDH